MPAPMPRREAVKLCRVARVCVAVRGRMEKGGEQEVPWCYARCSLVPGDGSAIRAPTSYWRSAIAAKSPRRGEERSCAAGDNRGRDYRDGKQ
jgi:hypothetical protein